MSSVNADHNFEESSKKEIEYLKKSLESSPQEVSLDQQIDELLDDAGGVADNEQVSADKADSDEKTYKELLGEFDEDSLIDESELEKTNLAFNDYSKNDKDQLEQIIQENYGDNKKLVDSDSKKVKDSITFKQSSTQKQVKNKTQDQDKQKAR